MPSTQHLLQRARDGDNSAAELLFDMHRRLLRQMIAARMDRRMAARIDPSDVVQEALAEASRRFSDYVKNDGQQFYPWLRRIAWEKLVQLHRHHIDARRRSVDVEVQLSQHSSGSLSQYMAANAPTPSAVMARHEIQVRMRAAIDRLDQHDREVLILRHLEQLPMAEVAAVLQISLAAAQSRYRRAFERLHDELSQDQEKNHDTSDY